jgi:ABC-type multidrug transport system ATPase subunit
VFKDLPTYLNQTFTALRVEMAVASQPLKITCFIFSIWGSDRISHRRRLELRENIYSKVNIAAPYTDLIEELDLREMIRFHTKFKHSPVLTTAGQWLEMLELSNVSSRPLLQFSSGMKQRVKLGLALYSSGDILLLDEPTSNLDDAAKAWFFTHLAKLRKDKLILIASNEAEDFKYCAEILRLD